MVAFSQVLVVLAALSAHAAGWQPTAHDLVARQDSETPAPSQPTPSQSQGTGSRTRNVPNTTGELNTGATEVPSATGSENSTATGNRNGTRVTSRPTFNPVDPAGGVNIISPVTTTGTVLYRIGQTITFQWNYTSLQGTPTALDVLVTATTASLKFTLTQNMSYEATGTYTWDTNKYQQTAINQPLLTDEFGLIIFDSDTGLTGQPDPGYLAPFNGFKFGIYEARPYQNLSDWKCATCSAASRDLDSKALGFAVAMASITVLSFTWFVTGIGGLP